MSTKMAYVHIICVTGQDYLEEHCRPDCASVYEEMVAQHSLQAQLCNEKKQQELTIKLQAETSRQKRLEEENDIFIDE